jgi:hypothetical protein
MFHRGMQYATWLRSSSLLGWSRYLGLLSKITALGLLGVPALRAIRSLLMATAIIKPHFLSVRRFLVRPRLLTHTAPLLIGGTSLGF